MERTERFTFDSNMDLLENGRRRFFYYDYTDEVSDLGDMYHQWFCDEVHEDFADYVDNNLKYDGFHEITDRKLCDYLQRYRVEGGDYVIYATKYSNQGEWDIIESWSKCAKDAMICRVEEGADYDEENGIRIDYIYVVIPK